MVAKQGCLQFHLLSGHLGFLWFGTLARALLFCAGLWELTTELELTLAQLLLTALAVGSKKPEGPMWVFQLAKAAGGKLGGGRDSSHDVEIGAIPAFDFIVCLDWRRKALTAHHPSGSVVPPRVTPVHTVLTGQMAGGGQLTHSLISEARMHVWVTRGSEKTRASLQELRFEVWHGSLCLFMETLAWDGERMTRTLCNPVVLCSSEKWHRCTSYRHLRNGTSSGS